MTSNCHRTTHSWYVHMLYTVTVHQTLLECESSVWIYFAAVSKSSDQSNSLWLKWIMWKFGAINESVSRPHTCDSMSAYKEFHSFHNIWYFVFKLRFSPAGENRHRQNRHHPLAPDTVSDANWFNKIMKIKCPDKKQWNITSCWRKQSRYLSEIMFYKHQKWFNECFEIANQDSCWVLVEYPLLLLVLFSCSAASEAVERGNRQLSHNWHTDNGSTAVSTTALENH